MSRLTLGFVGITAIALFISSCTKDDDPPMNKVPVADAGASKTITLPVDSATLTGTGTDADGKVVAYLWSQVSGPAATSIVNPGSPSTSIHGFLRGTYIFQLEVTDDKGATGVDTVSVVVNPSSIKTLTLQPANNPTEMRVTVLNGVSQTGTAGGSIDVDTWTSGGQLWILRGLLKFDMNSIPSTATIKSANLYLYSNPTPQTGDLVNANAGPTNSFTVQQVTADWSPSTLTWFNQPGSTTNNQVAVANTSSSFLDLNLDVTNMVASMVNTQANYGFLMKLDNEVTYNSRIFVGSYNTTYPDKHPKLVITYQ